MLRKERIVKQTITESAAWSVAAATLIGTGIHWFVTPMSHPGASRWQIARVVLQLVLGVAAGLYATRRFRYEQEIEREEANLDIRSRKISSR